jgi:phage/plasmid-associated DNA primase
MEFKYLKEDEKKANGKYIYNIYGDKKGTIETNYDYVKKNCIKTKEFCLVEKKTQYYVLSWDLDFKEKIDEYYRENHEKITKYIIEKINESIDEIIISADKDYVYAETTKGLGKHIYYIFIQTDVKLHLKLYERVMKKIENENKYNINIMNEIIDKTVCGDVGLRLFGCINEGGYYYPVKEKSTYKIMSGDIEKDFEYCLLNTEATEYNYSLKIQLEDEIKVKTEKKIEQIKPNYKKSDNTEIIELLEIIQEKNQNYNDWIRVGIALHTTNDNEEMREIWKEWSETNYKFKPKQFDSLEEEINYKWGSFKEEPKPLTIGTIKKMAKDLNIEKYIEWYNKNNKKPIVELIKDFDQQTVSIYFKKQKPNNYIYKKGEWYVLLENNLWHQMYKNENSKLINDITETIKGDLIELKNNLKPEDELLKLIPSVSKKLGTSKFVSGVIDYLREKYRNDSIEFDTKSNLFGFNNIVYDLELNEFRNYQKEDLITITTGYDWKEPNEEEVNLIKKLLCQIQTEIEIRNFYLDIYCSGLWGTTLQYYIIFNGSGSNGKSMMDDLILKCFGNYGHVINSIVLCEQRRQGANTEIANCHKKRLIISREPSTKNNVKLSNSLLRELTGGSEISARKIYSDNEKTSLQLTLIIECNKKPLLEEEPQPSDIRRIIDLLFGSKFTDDNEIINNVDIFEKNTYYVEEEFREKYKYALMKILFEHNKNHYKKKLIIPEEVKKRTLKYVESSVEILEWFNQTYEKMENYNKSDYVKISDINNELKDSEYYNSLDKKEKRNLTREKIVKLFRENPIFKNNFSEETDTHINGEKIKHPIRLCGYKKREINYD